MLDREDDKQEKRPIPERPGLGERRARHHAFMRVDHAGELAAVHIYRAQAAVFAGTQHNSLGEDMKRQEAEEQVHLDYFENAMRKDNIRPSLMTPLWRIMATGLGTATALMGEKAAHACTEAVESVIEAHYAEQIKSLDISDPALAADLKQFRDDELKHRDHAIDQGARDATAYPLLSAVIKTGCQLAIKIAHRV